MIAARTARLPGPLVAAAGLGAYAAAIAIIPSRTIAALAVLPLLLIPLAWWTLTRPGRWVAAFIAAALLLPPLPYAFGNSGPHPSLVFAALGLMAGALLAGAWRIPADSLPRALIALWLALLCSLAFGALYSGAEIAAASLARVMLFGIGVYLFFFVAYAPAATLSLRFLFWVAASAALIACVDFYYQLPAPAGFGPQFVWLASGIYRRAQGMFYEASTLGNLCACFLVMIAVALTRPAGQVPISRRALFTGGVIFSAALVFSYSRASVLNVLVALGALLYLQRARVRLRKAAMILGLSAAAGAAVSYLAFPEFAGLYWQRLSNTGLGFFLYTAGTLSGRVESWRFLANFLSENPWHLLFGVGYKTLPYSTYLGRTVIADNMYLSMLVETGVLGLAALLWFNLAILRAGFKAARDANPRAAFFGTWISCFWLGQCAQMLSADLLTYWRVMPIYFLVLAWAVRESRPALQP
ncbi:MAG: O-antigen ligase family protein [Candidatus Solibacter usitatus]|nr:O-antigen ligase family protein [Candidatus Solibacter usitatus]